MNITIIGTGFVGVVSAAVYASFGHTVIGLDVDKEKISSLKSSKVPFYEPNLEDLLKEQQKAGRLTFTTSYKTAISDADIIFIAVGTPSAPDGQADLRYVLASAESLAPYLKPNTIVVVKSTVPPGTLSQVEKVISQKTKTQYFTASVPEFLKEGTAVHDTLHPDRIVIGATHAQVFEKLALLHKPLQAPIIRVKPESAQMAKYAANSYLATRITFINQIADLCEKNGADILDIIRAIGDDKRIGGHYWYPGLGYGGSCFPKDVKELAAYSRSVGESDNLLNKVNDLNEQRIGKLFQKFDQVIGGWENKTVAVLGLSFKPHTDDMREAPATKIIPWLIERNAKVRSYDPMASWSLFEKITKTKYKNHTQFASVEDACKSADVILALVEWPQIISHDFSKLKKKPLWFIDTRNQFDPSMMEKIGFQYLGIGRK